MNELQVRDYLMGFPEATEDWPFGPEARVFKVKGKLFAIMGLGQWQGEAQVARVNLKSDPDEALMQRDMYPAVIPGYHMNKKHWNTVILDGSIPADQLKRFMDTSYALVVKKLPSQQRRALFLEYGETAVYR